jgi:hypothetical protein
MGVLIASLTARNQISMYVYHRLVQINNPRFDPKDKL